jgi:hypothetical protein
MLDLTVQSLDDVERTIKQYVTTERKKGHHPTLHGIYGNLRSQARYSFIGDYPLLHQGLVALKKIGVPVKRSTVASCVNRHCKDLKGRFVGKKDILEQLYQTL